MNWDQKETPFTEPTETQRRLRPEYDSALEEFPLTVSEWTHVCSCRFGEARKSAWEREYQTNSAGWTGDSYRYDIYRKGKQLPDGRTMFEQVALRWCNGAGKGWLVDNDSGAIMDKVHILSMIADMPDEARRWDACHSLWETAEKTALAAKKAQCQRLFSAFCEGRMKKRKRGGKYTMEIMPKITMAGALNTETMAVA